MKANTIKIIIVLGMLLAGGYFLFGINSQEVKGSLDEFAQCLAQKEITMYGAEWCPHCKNEKKRFGSSFQYVPYVECPDNPNMCVAKGVNGYPTWIFPDGKKLEGEQGLKKLSEESSCQLPEGY